MATFGQNDPAVLHVSSAEITEHVSWSLAIEAARAGAEAAASHGAEVRRTTLPLEGGWMRLMAATVPTLGVFGYKEFHLTADGSVRYCIRLFDAEGGRPLGIVDAALVTTLRTAATAAVAVEHILGPGTPVRLAVVGSGAESLAGVRALQNVIKPDTVTVTSRNPANRAAFARQAEETTGLVVTPCETAVDALDGADLVYSATNSGGRVVLHHDDVAHVPVIASIGSTLPEQRELSGGVFLDADRVIVDTTEVFDESGDAISAISAGFERGEAEVLGEALRRDGPSQARRTLYKSIGSPLQDISLAAAIIEAAEDRGFGRLIEPLSAVKVNL